jgi:DNA-binding GntR family transcriptional regulator
VTWIAYSYTICLVSTVERVQEFVTGQMLSGELRPGSWVRQDELAEQLDVSKIPVREALQRLAAVGLLRFEPNRGVTMPTLSVDDAEEHFELRRAVEPRLLARAVPRLTIADLAQAEMALDIDGTGHTEANWRFHRALYAASGWQRGLDIVASLNIAVAPYVLLYTAGLGGGDTSDDQHRRILEACRSGDADQAIDLLRVHLDDAEQALRSYLAREEDAT